ncbi:hypothetical protein PF008_g1962 [Phytophthora fragariae]|uniref:Uncharacterized protein n=1 Tax=Phytophthora fragariae TaxID=53985 RepID=A0A6G0SIS1_9STRA|nr:hypothetical protein PF008_g1962 [Phytophthora fragariae]
MRARSNSRVMSRKTERLWEQRRLAWRLQQQQERQNAVDEQWRVRRQGDGRVQTWWSYDDERGATQPDNTSWSSRCRAPYLQEPDERRREPSVGSPSDNTTNYCRMDGSWKTRGLEKSCNSGAGSLDPTAADGDGRQWRWAARRHSS